MLILVLTFPASASRPWSEGTGETPEFWSETITLLAPEPRHFTQQQETGAGAAAFISAAFISARTSTHSHSLDILKAKLTLLQCVVCAHARERWSE